MNKWLKRIFAALLIFSQFVITPSGLIEASANNTKQAVKSEVKETQREIEENLSEASEITLALEKLEKEIEEQELSIEATEEEIEEQEVLVEERYNYTAEQLKTMQIDEVNQKIVIGLFQSESLADFINRLYTVSVLTSASEDLLVEAHEENEKLNDMKEKLVLRSEELNEKKENVIEQKDVLDEKLSELKSSLAASQSELDKLNASEAKKSQTKSAKITTKSSNQASGKNKGSWMNFQSTGYSTQQRGLSSHTAMGINLLVNPRVIAVDPSQIPLGSLVEVEGMGVYIAGDTGGAIKGRIIDVHFPTVSQALSWGRRNVRIRVLD